jgi:hypothetical protein
MIYLINSPVLTSFGSYNYSPVAIDEVRRLINENAFTSAVGHVETASLLTRLLGIPVPMNRIVVQQQVGDTLVVIKPKTRLEANRTYSESDIENIGYEFGLLTRSK